MSIFARFRWQWFLCFAAIVSVHFLYSACGNKSSGNQSIAVKDTQLPDDFVLGSAPKNPQSFEFQREGPPASGYYVQGPPKLHSKLILDKGTYLTIMKFAFTKNKRFVDPKSPPPRVDGLYWYDKDGKFLHKLTYADIYKTNTNPKERDFAPLGQGLLRIDSNRFLITFRVTHLKGFQAHGGTVPTGKVEDIAVVIDDEGTIVETVSLPPLTLIDSWFVIPIQSGWVSKPKGTQEDSAPESPHLLCRFSSQPKQEWCFAKEKYPMPTGFKESVGEGNIFRGAGPVLAHVSQSSNKDFLATGHLQIVRYFACGNNNCLDSTGDAFLTRFAADGTIKWSKTFIESWWKKSSKADFVTELPKGNILLVGDGSESKSQEYAYLKTWLLSSSGSLLRVTRYLTPCCLKQTRFLKAVRVNNGVVVLVALNNKGSESGLLLLGFDLEGNIRWSKSIVKRSSIGLWDSSSFFIQNKTADHVSDTYEIYRDTTF